MRAGAGGPILTTSRRYAPSPAPNDRPPSRAHALPCQAHVMHVAPHVRIVRYGDDLQHIAVEGDTCRISGLLEKLGGHFQFIDEEHTRWEFPARVHDKLLLMLRSKLVEVDDSVGGTAVSEWSRTVRCGHHFARRGAPGRLGVPAPQSRPRSLASA